MDSQSNAATNRRLSAREEIKRIFFATCELDPADRETRLRELCGSNATLKREIEQLLENDLSESLFDSDIPDLQDQWIGKTVQSYRIIERIGVGGMGMVYRGEDIRLRRAVAIKFLGIGLVRDRSQRERFLREAQAAASVQHPSICTVFDIGEVDGRPFIVTAYLPGETLEEATKRHGPSLPTAIEYGIQLASALHAAHAEGIVHRDLKPSNVILTPGADGRTRATIIDFGLAQVNWDGRLTQSGRLIGTANYICPQLLRGESIAGQADIWSLGVMLYELLAGRPPFDADNRERLFGLICEQDPPPLRSVRPDLPEEIERIVATALEKDVDRRYRTAGDLLADLRAFRRDRPVLFIAPVQPPPSGLAASDGVIGAAEPPAAVHNHVTPRAIKRRLLVGAGVAGVAAAVWMAWTGDNVTRESGGRVLRVALLPFEDLSPGERNEALSAAMGEALAARLAGFNHVQMVSTAGIRNDLNRGASHHEISSRLRLDLLVTGFVERSGSTLRVTANLISCKDYTILASKKLDLQWSNTLTMQNQFAASAAPVMGAKFTTSPR